MKSKKIKIKGSLRQTLDKLYEEGETIEVSWEGGNDSGGFTVYVSGREVDYGDEFGNEVLSVIESEIDYGSWAGDYYVDGRVRYDPDEGAFVGEGKESVTEYASFKTESDLVIKVPKILNFDRIMIDIEGNPSDDYIHSTVKFEILNGPVFQEHMIYEKRIEDYLIEYVKNITEDRREEVEGDITSTYNDWVISRSEMFEEEDNLCFSIKELGYGYDYPTYNNYFITVNEEE